MVAGLLPCMLIDGGVLVPEITSGVGALICTDGVPERIFESWSPVMQTGESSDFSTQSCFVVKLFAKPATAASSADTREVIEFRPAESCCTASTRGAMRPM